MALKKLNETQWRELQAQYEKPPQPGEPTEQVGEHYFLMHMLARFGYRENDTMEAMKLAERLLNNGY